MVMVRDDQPLRWHLPRRWKLLHIQHVILISGSCPAMNCFTGWKVITLMLLWISISISLLHALFYAKHRMRLYVSVFLKKNGDQFYNFQVKTKETLVINILIGVCWNVSICFNAFVGVLICVLKPRKRGLQRSSKVQERKLDASTSPELKGKFLILCKPQLKEFDNRSIRCWVLRQHRLERTAHCRAPDAWK